MMFGWGLSAQVWHLFIFILLIYFTCRFDGIEEGQRKLQILGTVVIAL
jgi:hypothetical protein